MRRLLLLFPGLLLCLGVAPAWAQEQVAFEYECVSGKLQATRGQKFNLNVVPRDEDDSDGNLPILVEEAEIIRPETPGFFGNAAMALAELTEGAGPVAATPDLPFQLDTRATTDNAVEAYARVEFFVVGEECGFNPLCIAFRLQPPAVAVFRLGSDNMVNDGTNAALNMSCTFDGTEEIDPEP